MNRPRNPGAAMDHVRYRSWLERFAGYRRPITRPIIQQWLKQFAEAHRDLAARMLDAVVFIGSEDIHRTIRQLLSGLQGWHKVKARRQGRWFFVAFSTAAGESGDAMLYQLRLAASMTGARYNDLFIYKSDLVAKMLGPDDTVVLVDDFAGTGTQACKAWPTFQQLIPGNSKVILMLVAATKPALDRIKKETEMQPICGKTLHQRDNFFGAECTYFTAAEKTTTFQYCHRADPGRPKGFGDAGLLVVLAHRTPNNTIPIMHVRNGVWQGLFPRHN